MSNIRRWGALWFVFLSAWTVALGARPGWETGDWVSWTNLRMINDIEEYRDIIYVATDGGIARYDLRRNRWIEPLTVSDGLIDREITSIYLDETTGDLVYRTPHGDAAYRLFADRPSEWFSPTPESNALLRQSGYQRARYPNVIPPPEWMYSPDGILTDQDLREYETVDQVIDFWDNMWLAIRGYGLAVREWDTARLRLLPYSLWEDDLRAIDHFGDNFWFVGEGAINVHNRDLDAWAKFEDIDSPFLISDNVFGVLAESTRVWLATDAGLSRYDGRTGSWTTFTPRDGLPDERVSALAADTGAVWVGTQFGVARLDRRTEEVRDVSEGDYAERTTYDLAVVDTTVWAGTDAGLYVSRDRGAHWQRFTWDDAIGDVPVTVVRHSGERLWCASRMGVLGVDPATGAKVRFPAGIYLRRDVEGEQPAHALSVCSDGELLWVGTDQGVYRIEIESRYTRLFTTDDGLIHNEVRDIELDEDYIWFATPEGVTRFYWNDPERVD